MIESGIKPQTGTKTVSAVWKILGDPKLRKIFEAIITIAGLIGSAGGVIIYGDTIYNNTTTYPEDPELPDHSILNKLPTSGSSSEPDENKAPVTSPKRLPKATLKETTTNNYFNTPKSHGSNCNNDNDAEEIDDPIINSFDVTRDRIAAGESTTLSWSVSGAAYATISPDIGNVQSSGSNIIDPTKTTTYTITATNEAGIDDKELTVYVEEIEPPTVDTFEVDLDEISAGDIATLKWSVSGDAGVTIEPDIGDVSASGSIQVTPIETTAYTITATNEAGNDEGTITVYVEEIEPPAIDSFEADFEEIVSGDAATLSWRVSGDADVSIEPAIGDVQSSGSMTVNPTETTIYTIIATNKAGSKKDIVTVSVKKIEPPIIDSFEAYPEDITAGNGATLSWSVSGDADVTIEPDIGSVLSSGSMTINPTETTIYTIMATNEAGSDEGTVVVSVKQMEPPAVDSFEVYPEEVAAGDSATLSWSVFGNVDVTIEPDIGNVLSSGSMTINPTETTIYTITATNGFESAQDTVIVSVEEIEPPIIDSFETYPEDITAGGGTTLSWSVSGDADVSIEPDIGDVSTSGSVTVNPAETTIYTITATNEAGNDEETVTVYVEEIESPAVNSFEVYPEEITAGDSATLSWSVSGDADISIEPDIGSVLSSGSMTINPTETTIYSITATNEAGIDKKEVTIYVEKIEPPTIDSFEAYPEDITAGNGATLSWSVSGDADVTIEPDIGDVSTSGSVTVNPAETTIYTITATNEAGSDYYDTTIYVEEIEPSTVDSSETDSGEVT